MTRNQVSVGMTSAHADSSTISVDKGIRFLLFSIGIGIILILVTIALAAATLTIVIDRLEDTTETTTNSRSLDSEYAKSIQISDVMRHLNELQRIANDANDTRAINTPGFNRTLDYVYNYLSLYTNFKVAITYFYLRNFILASNPILLTSINGVITNRTFSTDLSASEFYFAQYTRSANFSDYISITVIPNVGCSDDDWFVSNPSASGRIALVKRGECTFVEKALLVGGVLKRSVFLALMIMSKKRKTLLLLENA